jgi:O-antigen/teichoic acid export membrane protein
MASGIRNVSITFATQMCTMAMGVGTESCLAWFLGTSGRGSYAVCLLFATWLSLVFGVGSDIASIYFVSSKRFSLSEGITYTLICGGIGSGLALIAGLILMQFHLPFFDKASPTGFYLALATVPVLLVSSVFMGLLTAVQQFGWFATVSILNSLAKLLLTIVFVWFLSWSVNGALLAVFITGIITIGTTLVLFSRKYSVTLTKPSMKKIMDMLHYGARYYIGKISNEVNFQMGTIILALFATKEEVGLFAVASQITARAMIIPDSLITVLIPKVAENEAGKRELVAQCLRLTALTCGVLLSILAVFAKPIVEVLFSPAFIPTVPLIQILTIGVLVRCACKVFVPYLLGTNHPGAVSVSTAVGAIVNLLTCWLLLPLIGLGGAAIAMVAGYLVGSALLTFSFVGFSGLALGKIFRFRYSDIAMIIKAVKDAGKKNWVR